MCESYELFMDNDYELAMLNLSSKNWHRLRMQSVPDFLL